MQAKLECTWQHVPRDQNVRADLLANIAMDSRGCGEVFDASTGVSPSATSPPPPSSASGLARRVQPGNAASAAPAGPARTGVGPAGVGPSGTRTGVPGSAHAAPSSAPSTAPSRHATTITTPSPGSRPAAPHPSFASAGGGSSGAGTVGNDQAEAAALASAKAAYAAVAADARARMSVGTGASGASAAPPVPPSYPWGVSADPWRGATAQKASLAGAAGAASGGGAAGGVLRAPVGAGPPAGVARGAAATGAGPQMPVRRFMVHVASWRRAEDVAGAAAAAVLYEEGPWRRLQVRQP